MSLINWKPIYPGLEHWELHVILDALKVAKKSDSKAWTLYEKLKHLDTRMENANESP